MLGKLVLKIPDIMVGMKRLLTLIIFTFILNLPHYGVFCTPAYALEPLPAQLSVIENSLWGFEYKKDSDAGRLKRIENQVFGAVDAKSATQDRINKVRQTLGLENTSADELVAKDLEELEGKGVSYPVIDKLEMEFLKKNFLNEGIYARLDRLEKSVFGATQNGDLTDRVDRLVGSSSINARPQQKTYSPDNYTAQGLGQQLSRQQYNDSYYEQDLQLQIAGLENQLFKKNFSQDPMGLRLNRLERKIFQRDFSSDDDFTRFQRLQAASTAKNTSKYYDGNKIQKYASTGMQIGTILLMILAFIL